MRRLLTCSFLTLGLACGSSVTTTTDDAAARPDAVARPDATANPDATARPDAAEQDAGINADATVNPDAAEQDAGFAPDAMVIPCGPVARAQGPDQLAASLAVWLGRCNPELSAVEAAALASSYAFGAARPAFEDLALAYDPIAAGACGCAIEAAPCDRLAALKTVPSCERVFTGTATIGDLCASDYHCGESQYCGAPLVEGAPPIPLCVQVCLPLVQPSQPCDVPQARCTPGHFCNFDNVPPTCEPKPVLGATCDQGVCAGDREDVAIFAPVECRSDKSGNECSTRGRGGSGDCFTGSCHDLYACQLDYSCLLEPNLGQACAVSIDVAAPSRDERATIIDEASTGCLLDSFEYCVQTGTTTGQGTCAVAPTLGQSCGIGAGLVPFCQHGAYCAGMDVGTLADVMSTCTAGLTSGSTCTQDLVGLFNDPCEAGSHCSAVFTGKGQEYRCAPMCVGQFGPGGL